MYFETSGFCSARHGGGKFGVNWRSTWNNFISISISSLYGCKTGFHSSSRSPWTRLRGQYLTVLIVRTRNHTLAIQMYLLNLLVLCVCQSYSESPLCPRGLICDSASLQLEDDDSEEIWMDLPSIYLNLNRRRLNGTKEDEEELGVSDASLMHDLVVSGTPIRFTALTQT